MKSIYPDFHILSAHLYVESGPPWSRDGHSAACHGLVEFSLGKDNKPRTLVYFNECFAPDKLPPFDLLHFIDGFLVRGSADIFHKLDDLAYYTALFTEINNGVVVEGKGYMFPFFGELWKLREDIPESAQVWENRSFQLSYHPGLRVVSFAD
jgi:hypothetical protein